MASEAHLIPVDLERMPRADFQRDAAADVDDVIGRDDLVALCMGDIVWSVSRQVRHTCVCVCVSRLNLVSSATFLSSLLLGLVGVS